MSQTADQMELREEDVIRHYPAALAMLQGIDHSPRIAHGTATAVPERSAGIGTRRTFRSTTPGLVTQRVTRSEGVQVLARAQPAATGTAQPATSVAPRRKPAAAISAQPQR